MNIILIGFMGAGKTTIGKLIAERLSMDFLDIDEEIEKQEQKEISKIFKEHGEHYFRDLETKYLKSIKNINKTVISTGGGLPIKEENQLLLNEIGITIFLDTSLEIIKKRLENDEKRPLAKNNLEELFEYRQPIYKNATQKVIDCDNMSIEEILNEIEKFN